MNPTTLTILNVFAIIFPSTVLSIIFAFIKKKQIIWNEKEKTIMLILFIISLIPIAVLSANGIVMSIKGIEVFDITTSYGVSAFVLYFINIIGSFAIVDTLLLVCLIYQIWYIRMTRKNNRQKVKDEKETN